MGLSCPERWPSGRRRAPAKGVWVKSPSRVRIPPSPPYLTSILLALDQLSAMAIKRGFEPEILKGGSTKSPKAILDDAHASPEGRGPKARVNPSLSANLLTGTSRFSLRQPRSLLNPAT